MRPISACPEMALKRLVNGGLGVARERPVAPAHTAGKLPQFPLMKRRTMVIAARLLNVLRIGYAQKGEALRQRALSVVPKRTFLAARTLWGIATVVFHICLMIDKLCL